MAGWRGGRVKDEGGREAGWEGGRVGRGDRVTGRQGDRVRLRARVRARVNGHGLVACLVSSRATSYQCPCPAPPRTGTSLARASSSRSSWRARAVADLDLYVGAPNRDLAPSPNPSGRGAPRVRRVVRAALRRVEHAPKRRSNLPSTGGAHPSAPTLSRTAALPDLAVRACRVATPLGPEARGGEAFVGDVEVM